MVGEKLSKKVKTLYGAGDFGFSLTGTMIGVLHLFFLLDVVGISPKYAALAIFIGKSWDWINDPLIGHLSDKTRSRWGRRRPFLLFGFLPYALAFALLWWKPPLTTDIQFVIYYAIAYFIYDAAATFVYMPYFALTPELTQDYDERTSLTSYRMFFSILAGLVAFTVPLMVIGKMQPENASKILWVGIAAGLAAGFPLLLTFFGVREKPEYQEQETPKLFDSIKAAIRNKPFLFAMGIFLFTWASIEIVQNMLLLFLKYRMDMEGQSDIILGTVFVVAMLFLPFWDWVSKKLDKRKAYIWGMIFLSIVLIILAYIKPDSGFTYILLLAGLAGIGVSAVHVLPWSMIPDAIEWDQLQTGERHEGMFYSIVTLFKKVANSIAVPMTALILESTGYIGNAAQQNPSTVKAIMMMTGPLPAAFMLVGIAFAILYPLNRKKYQEITDKLSAKE